MCEALVSWHLMSPSTTRCVPKFKIISSMMQHLAALQALHKYYRTTCCAPIFSLFPPNCWPSQDWRNQYWSFMGAWALPSLSSVMRLALQDCVFHTLFQRSEGVGSHKRNSQCRRKCSRAARQVSLGLLVGRISSWSVSLQPRPVSPLWSVFWDPSCSSWHPLLGSQHFFAKIDCMILTHKAPYED